VAFVVLALAACGNHAPRSPEAVARAWSSDLNRNDNRAAGALFARDATIVQTGAMLLHSRADAVQWNALLPCGGTITSVKANGRNQVLVIFTLTERPRHRCDAPGSSAATIFRVRNGKIVLWHQTYVPSAPAPAAGQTV